MLLFSQFNEQEIVKYNLFPVSGGINVNIRVINAWNKLNKLNNKNSDYLLPKV